MDRTFLLPLISLTALGSSGCGAFQPGIVGDWVGVSYVDSSGSFYNLPYTKSDTYDGVTYTYVSSWTLSAERDGSVVAGTYYQYTDSAGGSERSEDLYAGDWDREDGGFELRFQESNLNMDCTVDSGELECAMLGEWYEGATVTFEPADD